MPWRQKFRKSEISLDTGDSASNAVVKRSVSSVFSVVRRCAECVCLYTMDFVSAGKNTLLLYVTVCEKFVPRISTMTSSNEISWKLPPRNEELVAPLLTNIFFCSPLFRFKHFEASALLCVVKGTLLDIGRNLWHSLALQWQISNFPYSPKKSASSVKLFSLKNSILSLNEAPKAHYFYFLLLIQPVA